MAVAEDQQQVTTALQETASLSLNSAVPAEDGTTITSTSTTSSVSTNGTNTTTDTLVASTSSLTIDDPTATLTRSKTDYQDFAASAPARLKLRKPASNDPTFHGPSPEWLSGKWYIAHSTLPTWKDKRNVTITYSLTADEKLEDKVEFDPVFGGVRSVSGRQVASPKSQSNRKGTPRASPTTTPRGSLDVSRPGGGANGAESPKGGRPARLVRMNTVEAHEAGVSANDEQGEVVDWDWHGKGLIKLASAHWEILGWGGEKGGEWVVTYFKKTYVTPEGVNLYVRDVSVASPEFVQRVKDSLSKLGSPGMDKLVAQLYEVQRT